MTYQSLFQANVDIGQLQLISFDLWDTLLRRDSHPEESKLRTCMYMLDMFGERIKAEFRSPFALLEARNKVEYDIAMSCRQDGFDDEYEISNVLATLGTYILDIDWPSDEYDCIISALVSDEVATEVAATRLDSQSMWVLSQTQHIPKVIISDFYMTSADLAKIVAYHGIAGQFDRIVSSCDVKFNKKSGQLFEHLHGEFGIENGRWLHIGDNLHSDVAMAEARGIKAFHHNVVSEEARRKTFSRSFEARKNSARTIVNDLRGAINSPMHLAGESFVRLIQAYSTALSVFVERVIKTSRAGKVTQIICAGAGGAFYAEVLSEFVDREVVIGSLPTSLNAFRDPRDGILDAIDRMWSQSGGCTPAEVLIQVGLKPATYYDVMKRWRLSPNERVSSPRAPALLNLLRSEEVDTALETRLDAQIEALHLCLKDMKYEYGGPTLVLDDVIEAEDEIAWRALFNGERDTFFSIQSTDGVAREVLTLFENYGDPSLKESAARFSFLSMDPRGVSNALFLLDERPQQSIDLESLSNQRQTDFLTEFQAMVLSETKRVYRAIRRRALTTDELVHLTENALRDIHQFKYLMKEKLGDLD